MSPTGTRPPLTYRGLMTDRGDVRWMSVSPDVPADRLGAAEAFWTAVTRTQVGAPVGGHHELRPLHSPHADDCLWLQRTREDPQGVPHWTVLRAPVGLSHCITARRPGGV